MKKVRCWDEIFVCVAAAVCVLVAAFVKFDAASAVEILNLPFGAAGEFIGECLSGGNAAEGWCLYVFIGLLPLVFPIVRIARGRRFYWWSLAWALLSGHTYTMLYLTSHPSVLESVYMPGNDTFVLAQQGGLSIIWYALLTLCVLGECGMALKKNPRRSYLFAQVLLYAMAACIIFMAFFWGVVEAKNLWSEFGALPEELREHAAANRFAFIFTLLCEISAAVSAVWLILCGLKALRTAGRDLFDPLMIRRLSAAASAAKASVLVSLLSVIACNAMQLALSKWLIHISYSFTVSLLSLLAVCLVVIAIGAMKRAIAAHEENQLTI